MPEPRTLRRSPRATDESPVEPEATEEEVPFDGASAAAKALSAGWTAGQKTMDSSSTFTQSLIVTSTLQIVKFLEDQPYASYSRHWIDRAVPGQGIKKRTFTCLGSVGLTCPLCGIGDKPQAVSAFNVAVVGDDGEPLLKSWEVGARYFNVLKAYHSDPKVGPLGKGYFGVMKSGQGGSNSLQISPVSRLVLKDDYNVEPPSADVLDALDKYDSSNIYIPKVSDLEEIAQELADTEDA